LGETTVRLGDPVDDFTLLRADGSSLMLSAFAGKPLLLIFLRHLA
jgi:peroxiredoxin